MLPPILLLRAQLHLPTLKPLGTQRYQEDKKTHLRAGHISRRVLSTTTPEERGAEGADAGSG